MSFVPSRRLSIGLVVAVGAAVLGSVVQPTPAQAAPTPSVLISEVANGGAGADSNANRSSVDNFIEIANFGDEPADVSGWRIFRCGQTGDAYGPQGFVPDGTTLAPGDSYTLVRAGSSLPGDGTYDTSLHEFGFGAMLEDAEFNQVDAVGFYHPTVDSDCKNPTSLSRPLDHRLNQSHQRIGTTGDLEADWTVAERTPDAPNAAEPAPGPVDSGLQVSEVSTGDAASDRNQYVELANTTDAPIDITGWKLYRCGENGTTYLQNTALPSGSVVEPGGAYLVGHESAPMADRFDATYATGIHWRDFGFLLTDPEDRIAARAGFYANRNSICANGTPFPEKVNPIKGEVFQRSADSGDDAEDFVRAAATPGRVTAPGDIEPADDSFEHGPVRVSEIVGAGPAGGNDEFFEIANYGDQPVDLSGWSAYRCEGTGRLSPTPQIADLGDVTLAPGEVYVGAQSSASPAVLEQADGTYATGFNQTDGYGIYVTDADRALVDAVGVYETVTYSPCVIGGELRRETKDDQGESYQRARTTLDNEESFVKAERSPGTKVDHPWVDPTKPEPGQLDPVEVERQHQPEQPVLGRARPGAEGERSSVRLRAEDEDGGNLSAQLRTTSELEIDEDAARVYAGSTRSARPSALSVPGERRVDVAPELTTRGTGLTHPFQRYALPLTAPAADGAEFAWTGTAEERNEIQMYAWDEADGEWDRVGEETTPSGGTVTIVGALSAEHTAGDVANVLVIDGPRTRGGVLDEVDKADRTFVDPGRYDGAINHMTDTQFLSEGFRDVFRDMAAWVVANAQGRKIGYSLNTGDIIENWIGGNSDEKRARKEFAAARSIMDLINDAGVPNGVLPGNHDNFWGRNNDLYNEYFGPDVYQDKPWWGSAWRTGDNSAHYDYFEIGELEFLTVHLPYKPSAAQIDWAGEVVRNHPRHNVVLATHSYLTTEGDLDDRDMRHTARAKEIWDEVVAPNDNVVLTLGGHYHGVVTKYADPESGERVRAQDVAGEETFEITNVGENGRTVVEMLADYQGYRSGQPDPRADTLDRDTGFQRLLQIDVDAEKMAVNTYSPTLDAFDAHRYDEPDFRGENARYTQADDEFVVNLSLQRRTDLETTGWSLLAPSRTVVERDVRAGESTALEWDADAGDRWYARISDPTDQTSVSTVLEADAPVEEVATTTTATVSEPSYRYGSGWRKRPVVEARVVAEDADSDDPTPVEGEVELRAGSRSLGTAELRTDGTAKLRLPAKLAPGRHGVTARFLPAEDSGLAGSDSAATQVTVAKARPKVTSSFKRPTFRTGQRPTVRVRTSAEGVTPAGTVRVTYRRGNDRPMSYTTRLRAGKVDSRLPVLRRKGTYRVTVTYLGSTTVESAKASTRTIRVR